MVVDPSKACHLERSWACVFCRHQAGRLKTCAALSAHRGDSFTRQLKNSKVFKLKSSSCDLHQGLHCLKSEAPPGSLDLHHSHTDGALHFTLRYTWESYDIFLLNKTPCILTLFTKSTGTASNTSVFTVSTTVCLVQNTTACFFSVFILKNCSLPTPLTFLMFCLSLPL